MHQVDGVPVFLYLRRLLCSKNEERFMIYNAPVKKPFCTGMIGRVDLGCSLPGYEDARSMVDAILEEAAKFAEYWRHQQRGDKGPRWKMAK
jgi:hypothetical protein